MEERGPTARNINRDSIIAKAFLWEIRLKMSLLTEASAEISDQATEAERKVILAVYHIKVSSNLLQQISHKSGYTTS